MIKQLRVSRFLGRVVLSDSQRQLIKFMKEYVLYTDKKKKVKKRPIEPTQKSSLNDTGPPADRGSSVIPQVGTKSAAEALLDFKPNDDDIDRLLYEGIVD